MNKILFPVALTVAGSDSGGGAGIQADLRAFGAFGVYGCSAITAVTAQNPCEIRRIDPLPPASVKSQIETVFAKFAIGAVKTGMLFNAGIIKGVAGSLKNKNAILVVDPVMVSSGGTALLKKNAVEALKKEIFPLADWIMPNIFETESLLGTKIKTWDDMLTVSEMLMKRWDCNFVVKGGHLVLKNGGKTDLVIHEKKIYRLCGPALITNAAHGTGCTFSAALAASFAKGLTWERALISARAFVYGSLAESVRPGNDIAAMFPPRKNYEREIRLKAV